MRRDSAATPLKVAQVAPGEPGVLAVAAALEAVSKGDTSVALVPQYAPARTRRALQEITAAAASPSQPAICVPTSGSTGASRLVVIPWETLHHQAVTRDRALGGPAAWFLALPPATAGGVLALSRCLSAGTPCNAWPGVGGAHRFTAQGFVEAARRAVAQARDLSIPVRVSVVSMQLARILEHPGGADALALFDTVLVGGGPLAPQLREAAKAAGTELMHSYGLTETCGGCCYDGRPVGGTKVKIGIDGEILLAGPTLAAGYLDGPLPLVDGWLRTGDHGTWEGQRLKVAGRLDEIVVVRGTNVDLAAVAAVVAEVPGVCESAVVAVTDPAGGHLLEAFVAGSASPEQIRAAVAQALGGAAVPRVFEVPSLPTNQGGKVDLEALRQDAL